jgi:hypothetical protein
MRSSAPAITRPTRCWNACSVRCPPITGKSSAPGCLRPRVGYLLDRRARLRRMPTITACVCVRDRGAVSTRKPVLWDNYPVNDGARRDANFLRIDAFRGRRERARRCAHAGALRQPDEPVLAVPDPLAARWQCSIHAGARLRCRCRIRGLLCVPQCECGAGRSNSPRDLDCAPARAGSSAIDAARRVELAPMLRALMPNFARRCARAESRLAGTAEYAFDPACLTG